MWPLTDLGDSHVAGAAYDPVTGRIFVVEQMGDNTKPRIHVYTIGGSGSGSAADTAAPTVSLTAPSAGATISGTASLAANASDNVGVASVWFTVDGTTVGAEDTSAPYAGTFDTSAVANGSHALRALARDAAGNIAMSAATTVTVNNSSGGSTGSGNDRTAPTVAVAAPASNATITGTVTITAKASDNVGVTSVQFLVDGAAVGAPDTSSPYSYSWSSTTVMNGTHQVQAAARDAAGNVTTSSAVTIKVANASQGGTDKTSPTVSWISPTSRATVSGRVTLNTTATDNVGVTQVTYGVDGKTIGTSTNKSGYPMAWTTTGSSNGAHQMSAIARDAAGNTTTSTLSVTVRNTSRLGR